MRIEFGLVLGVLLVLPRADVSAQTTPVDAAVQVHAVRIEGIDVVDIDPGQLRAAIATRGRGSLVGLRRALRWVPFVPGVPNLPLEPLELQRDRERIRRILVRRGYPEASVTWEVESAGEPGAVDVVFVVRPGPPLMVDDIAVTWVGTSDRSGLDPDRAREEIVPQLELRKGEPLDRRTLDPATTELARWLSERGRAFARVEAIIEADTLAHKVRIVLQGDPGPRVRIGEVEILGSSALSERAVRGFARLRTGDPFALSSLESARDRVASLDVVDQTFVEVVTGQPGDTLVDVRVRVREEPAREIVGEGGYSSDGGVSAETRWTHRSLFRGAQVLSVGVGGQTGWWSLGDNPEKFVRGTVSLRQPIAGRPRLVLDLAPFVDYRNDHRDRSLSYGLEATVIQRLGALSSVAIRYQRSTRQVFEYRLGDISTGIDFLELAQAGAQGILDSLGARIDLSTLSLSGSFTTLDLPSDPSRGVAVEPSVTVTAPGRFNSVQYVTTNLRLSGYLPVSKSLTVAARAGWGRVFPFGKSIPTSQEEGLREYFRLRDVLFTAGGVDDVRGWGHRMLGPKFPQILLTARDSGLVVSADRYVPIGGFNRVHGTFEAQARLPFLGGGWGAHGFLDAGRVWTVDERFTDDTDTYGVERLFWAAGGGIDRYTRLGTVRLTVGYKLNPSILDLARPGDVAEAFLNDVPLQALPTYRGRRFRLHIGLGRSL